MYYWQMGSKALALSRHPALRSSKKEMDLKEKKQVKTIDMNESEIQYVNYFE